MQSLDRTTVHIAPTDAPCTWDITSHNIFNFSVFCLGVFIVVLVVDEVIRLKFLGRENRVDFNVSRKLWITFVLLLACTCLQTWIETSTSSKWIVLGGGVGLALFVLSATFFLEGVESAYTDLRDKEASQIRNEWLFNKIKLVEQEFYEAREWCVIAIVVLVTMIVDTDIYSVPYLGPLCTKQMPEKTLRYVITIGLTTLPFVWFAQSPGKQLAKDNSDHFLQLTATKLIARAVLIIRKVMIGLQIKRPSDFAERVYLGIYPDLNEERRLPPGELRYFTDSTKRYGYGTILSRDEIDIHDDGSCDFTIKTLTYICSPRQEFTRALAFSQPLAEVPVVDYVVLEIEEIGESVAGNLDAWFSLFDMRLKDVPGRRISLDGFDWILETKKSFLGAVRFKNIVDPKVVKIKFPFPLPWNSNPESNKAAASLMLIEIKGKTQAGAFKTLKATETECEEFYDKGFIQPCLRSEVRLRLKNNSAATFRAVQHNVTFDEVQHETEAERFRKMQRSYKSVCSFDSKTKPRGGVSEEGKTLKILVESAMPSAYYATTWKFSRLNSLNNVGETRQGSKNVLLRILQKIGTGIRDSTKRCPPKNS